MGIFEVDEAGMRYLMSAWDGPVGRDFDRRLKTLQYRAKMSAGVSTPNPTRIYPGGALRLSIDTDQKKSSPSGFSARVGSNRPYARYHHDGAGPHTIKPRKAGGRLRFWWPKVGAIVFRRKVNHPGNKPNPFLTRWLKEFVR